MTPLFQLPGCFILTRQDREGSQGLWQAPYSSRLTWGQSWSKLCRACERAEQVRGSLCLEGRGGRERPMGSGYGLARVAFSDSVMALCGVLLFGIAEVSP